MLKKFRCVEGCSDCCIYRQYYPSVEYGKVGVLVLPEEKAKLEATAGNMGVKIKIIPRIGIGNNKDRPEKIIAYQMMGKNNDGTLCPFLDVENPDRSPHGGFKCSIYEQRPLACRAYPVIEVKGAVQLDGKCQFCRKFSTESASKDGLEQEIEALTRIGQNVAADKEFVWRYATGTGDEVDRDKLRPEGWVLQA